MEVTTQPPPCQKHALHRSMGELREAEPELLFRGRKELITDGRISIRAWGKIQVRELNIATESDRPRLLYQVFIRLPLIQIPCSLNGENLNHCSTSLKIRYPLYNNQDDIYARNIEKWNGIWHWRGDIVVGVIPLLKLP